MERRVFEPGSVKERIHFHATHTFGPELKTIHDTIARLKVRYEVTEKKPEVPGEDFKKMVKEAYGERLSDELARKDVKEGWYAEAEEMPEDFHERVAEMGAKMEDFQAFHRTGVLSMAPHVLRDLPGVQDAFHIAALAVSLAHHFKLPEEEALKIAREVVKGEKRGGA